MYTHTNNPLFRQHNHMVMKWAYDMINGSENLHMHPLHSKQQHHSVLPRPSLRAAPFSKDHP